MSNLDWPLPFITYTGNINNQISWLGAKVISVPKKIFVYRWCCSYDITS